MKNFAGKPQRPGPQIPLSVHHELHRSSLQFYLGFKHRNYFRNHNYDFSSFIINSVRNLYIILCNLFVLYYTIEKSLKIIIIL